MARTVPMNRLLQGDVGSGKTLVAQYAMLLCVASECQAALMAPTEVLARQHFGNLQNSLKQSRVRIGLLVGSLSRKQRQEVLEQLDSGEIDLIVGTQALLSSDVSYKRLGLVIVDEQHKFGVLQRAKLRSDDLQPHNLILSATPIPRTIAMTAFGDLEVSTIRDLLPGRVSAYLSCNT
ncbi:MAG: DEAD/DEAH box helicase [Pirellulales bacterium]